MLKKFTVGLALGFCMAVNAFANTTVPMYKTELVGMGSSVGEILISETEHGLLFTPRLHDLTPGLHGFHVHDHPSCEHHGDAALGHLDPASTGKHLGPYQNGGHLGDLPALYVNEEGKATLPVLAPNLKHIAEIKNHALMIHENGDNYSDISKPLGGGGARMECGVI